MRRYKITTENNLLTVNGMLRKFIKSCMGKHSCGFSVENGESCFKKVLPGLPSNMNEWMICRLGDDVRMYGGNKAIIHRNKDCITIFRLPETRIRETYNSGVILRAIPRSELD